MFRHVSIALCLVFAIAATGCDQQVFDRIGGQFQDLVQDPLGLEPYPVLVGGNDADIYYATNLADMPYRVPGFKNEIVFPGLLGPSNVYSFTREKPELIRPLAPAVFPYSEYREIVTDGRFFAYIASGTDDNGEESIAVLVEDFFNGSPPLPPATVYESAVDGPGRPFDLRIDAGRLAIALERVPASVLIVDLLGGTADIEIEVGDYLWTFDLRGSRLAWISNTNRVLSATVRDFVSGETVVLSDPLVDTFWPNSANILLTANSVVWSEGAAEGVSRAWRYDFPTGEKRVWTDAVQGDLVGATDEVLLTQEDVWRDNVFVAGDPANLIVIRRYDADGKEKRLAEFRSQGLAGQARVLGNRAVFVNDRRDVVIAPFDDRDRRSFKPF